MHKIFAAFLFLSYISISNSANILAIYTLASPSIRLWNTPLLTALATRGHNVTVISPEAQKNRVANLTDLPVDGLYEAIGGDMDFDVLHEATMFFWIKEMFAFFRKGCLFTLKSDSFKRLMEYPTDFKFDLVLMEPIGVECMFGILPRFGNPPIVTVASFPAPQWVLESTGTPSNPSYVPYSFSPYDDDMKFMERVYNFIAYIYTQYLYKYDYLPKMDREARNVFGPEIASVESTAQNVSFALTNHHPTLDTPFASAPNLIPIAAIQVKDPKPLPTDLQKFLDDATEGAIYMSFGTNVRSDKLSLAKRKAILEAFAELPQRVLWKFESDLPDAPKNVKISKWLPQNDVLAHPNLKVFITHAGLHSTHETIIRGVPIVGVPFVIDQHMNIRKMQKLGRGLLLEYKDLTKDTLLHTLREIIGNPSYRENIMKLSARFQDNPTSPLESAVFWTEYALRHKGAQHLQSAARNLNFIQYFLLDVIAFLLAVPISFVLAIYILCCRRKSTQKGKDKLN
ncbi:hypothetical protein R5R35_012574 [Gryllus longicercus]|uniref:UDP-glucuronosyltransferase n=1 Tax=Gryllus longicercus TaxID=2509291 RepID=A0AAN9VR51_9ORTH